MVQKRWTVFLTEPTHVRHVNNHFWKEWTDTCARAKKYSKLNDAGDVENLLFKRYKVHAVETAMKNVKNIFGVRLQNWEINR